MKVKEGRKFKKMAKPLKGQIFTVKYVCAIPDILEGPALVNDYGIFFIVDNTAYDIRNKDMWKEIFLPEEEVEDNDR